MKYYHAIILAAFMLCCTAISSAADTTTPAIKKILILGDSITCHGPAPERLGWNGKWGMAASSQDKDYAHILYSEICKSQPQLKPELVIVGEGGGTITGKVKSLSEITAKGGDLAVIQLGENDRTVTFEGFQKPYETIINALKAMNPAIRIYCFSTWRCGGEKDKMIKNACTRTGAVFVDIAEVYKDPKSWAAAEKRFTHNGVNWHPGDKGMLGMAEYMWKAIKDNPSMPAPGNVVVEKEDTQKATEIIFAEDFDSESQKWNPAPNLVAGVNGKAALVEAPEPTSTGITIDIPAEKIRGKKIELTAMVKADNVSEKPKSYNGIKCMLIIIDAEARKDYPQARIEVGTFDWQKISLTRDIPDMAVSVKLRLGLESVSGKVWFDNVKLTTTP